MPTRRLWSGWPESIEIVRLLLRRFGDARLAQTAASLAFTSLVSLVPLVALGFALFTAFPAFHHLQLALQQRFAQALLPPAIADTVLRHLDQFAAQAKGLGAMGIAGLVVLATTMLLTVDKALNAIWRTARPRPLAHRVLLYWTALTLGPLLIGGALAASGTLLAAHQGWMHRRLDHGADVALGAASWLLSVLAFGALYRYVPNTEVRWRDALSGGLLAALGFALAGRAFAWYIDSVPTYTVVYGAFAALPLFLLWLDWSWMVVLLGALLAATLPLMRVRARPEVPGAGADFVLAVRALRRLDATRQAPPAGLGLLELAAALRCDPLRLQPLLDALEDIGWIARLAARPLRWALLVDPQHTPIAALVDRLLLQRDSARRLAPQLDALLGSALDAHVLQQLLDSTPHDAGQHGSLTPH